MSQNKVVYLPVSIAKVSAKAVASEVSGKTSAYITFQWNKLCNFLLNVSK